MKSFGRIILILFLIFPITGFLKVLTIAKIYQYCMTMEECHNPNGMNVFINELSKASTFSPQMKLSVISGKHLSLHMTQTIKDMSQKILSKMK